MKHLIYFKQFEEVATNMNGYQQELAKQTTQSSAKKPVVKKSLPSETDDIENIKNQIDQNKNDLIATKDNIEKLQINSFEEDNKKEVQDKIKQYQNKTKEVGKLVKDFDTTIKKIKTENKPSTTFRSQEAQARQKNI